MRNSNNLYWSFLVALDWAPLIPGLSPSSNSYWPWEQRLPNRPSPCWCMALWLSFTSRSLFVILSSLNLEKLFKKTFKTAQGLVIHWPPKSRGLVIGSVGIFAKASAKDFFFFFFAAVWLPQTTLETSFRNAVELWSKIYFWLWASLVAQVVKNLPAMQEMLLIPGWEGPLEKGMAIHSSVLAWRIPWTEELCGQQSRRLQSQTWLTHTHFWL